MTKDHSADHYYVAKFRNGYTAGWFGRLYRFDETGNKEITVKEVGPFPSKEEAEDGIVEYIDENGIDATLE